MKRLLLLALLSSFYLLPAHAQGNYKTGYVVSLNGDTTKGFIDYREWNKNPREISFKKELNAKAIEKYSTKNASAFAVSGYELYKKYTVSISQNLDDQIERVELVDSTYKIDTVFLKTLVKGRDISLYQYKDGIKQRYYIAEKNQVPYELLYRRYLDGTLHILGDRIYFAQLQKLALVYQPQNSALLKEIGATPYYREELTKIVMEINGKVVENEFSKLAIRSGPRLYIGFALNNTTEQVKGNNEFSAASPSTSIFPQINLGLDFIFNKNVGTALVRTGFALSGNKTSLSVSPSPYGSAGTDYLKFNQYTASLSFQFLYNFLNQETLKLYLAGGGAVNYSIYSNEQTYGISAGTKYSVPLVDLEPPGFFTPMVSAGLVINKNIDIHLTYIIPSPIDSSPQYYIRFTQYQFGVNYLFGK